MKNIVLQSIYGISLIQSQNFIVDQNQNVIEVSDVPQSNPLIESSNKKYISNEECLKLNPWMNNVDFNTKPVIGILSQTFDFTPDKDDKRFEGYKSYIMAAYVKSLEAAGARVIPILYNEPMASLLNKLERVNGILFPGGGGEYMDVANLILDYAIQQNDQGKFYPIWGTCLGFERIAMLTAQYPDDVLHKIQAHAVSLPLKFQKDPKQSKMFCSFGEDAFEFEKNKYTLNSHTWSIEPKTFEDDKKLKEFWDVTSTSFSPDDQKEFVTSIEAKKYPFMATQFHPEKVTQVWASNSGINHSWESVTLNKKFAELFVMMARASPNKFGDFENTYQEQIENHKLVVTNYYVEDAFLFE